MVVSCYIDQQWAKFDCSSKKTARKPKLLISMVNIGADSIDFLFRIKIMTPRSHTINCGQCLYIYLSRIHSVTLLSDSCFRRGTETFITFCPIPPDPFDKNSNFTCGHRIHWSTATSICLFVLLCNVCESELTFQNPKATQKLKNNIIQSRQQ